MASAAAVRSLQRTILRLASSSILTILPSFLEILEVAYDEARSLQEYLDRLESSSCNRVNVMNAQIREAASKLEDAILSHVSDQCLSQTEDQIGIGADQIFSIDLGNVKEEFSSFTETSKRIMKENRMEDLLAEEDDDISLATDFGGKCSKMVGFSDLFSKIRDELIDSRSENLDYVSLIGMAGIGKTTLAMKIFEDPEIKNHFEHRVFVTIGPKYKIRVVMLDILTQLTSDIDGVHKKGVDDVGKYLYKTLSFRRYLIVLDDIWHKSVYKLVKYLPHYNYHSRILVTTRIEDLAYVLSPRSCFPVPFLNKDESWDLLRQRVFGENYPFHLEKYGKKIAENCEGLPLSIVMVAGILSKNETPEYWEQTAEKKNSVFIDAYDRMFPVLFLSYKYLDQYLKPCFLYTGVFPPAWKITTSKIVKLLIAERFARSSIPEVRYCLEKLISRSLVLSHQQSSRLGTKTWSLHSANWHMCNKLAGREKFFHFINSYPNSISTVGIISHQRVCIHNNVLFGIKEVRNWMESILTVRSLLCTGLHHPYPVRICFDLRFLRVLDALTVRLYKFPFEVLKLVQLRYLALTCNGMSLLPYLSFGTLSTFLSVDICASNPLELGHICL